MKAYEEALEELRDKALLYKTARDKPESRERILQAAKELVKAWQDLGWHNTARFHQEIERDSFLSLWESALALVDEEEDPAGKP